MESRSSSQLSFARFAWAVLAFNLFVILWGAFVRASGSGAGCGSHWPLCNGEVVPRAPAVETLIELGHRLTSGMALLLVGGLLFGAWRRFPPGHVVRSGAVLSMFLILTEALIGAGLVLFEMVADNASIARGFWISGHLINTFLLVAALALTAWWASGGRRLRLEARGLVLLLAGLLPVLVLGMSGAITALGDTLFPATSLSEAKAQTMSDTSHLFIRLRVWHPMLAVCVGVALVFVCWYAMRAGVGQTGRLFAYALLGVYALQLFVGLVNVWLLAPIALQLIHLMLSDVVWILLVLLVASVLAEQPASQTGAIA
jgi:heme A synthase